MKEVEVNGKKFVVRELLATELDNIDLNDSKNSIRKQVILSTGISEDEYNKLTVKERGAILKVITELNYPDFLNPTK